MKFLMSLVFPGVFQAKLTVAERKEVSGCRRQDLNLHFKKVPRRPLWWYVYQFRHVGKIDCQLRLPTDYQTFVEYGVCKDFMRHIGRF